MSQEDRTIRLTLYVAGQTVRAERALDNLRGIVEDQMGLDIDLRLIDVVERPDLAEDAMILATPTLVRESPGPVRRLMGDLSDPDKVLRGLQIQPVPPSPSPSGDGAAGAASLSDGPP